MGFGTVSGAAVMNTGAKALPSAHPAAVTPAAHATGRQRRDGSVPVGNSSRTNTTKAMPASQSQPSQWDQTRVPGNCASSSEKAATEYVSPVADSSQPIGLAGRFHASSAPTVAKDGMKTSVATPVSAFPCKPPPVGSGCTWL